MSDDAAPMGPMTWVLGRDDLEWMIEAVRACREIVVDLETTGLDEHAVNGGKTNGGVSARIALASFTLPDDSGGEPVTWVLPLSHPDSPWLGQWRSVLRRVMQAGQGKPIINQNIKFDARWIFVHTGVDISGQISWDTQISSHLLDETSSTRLKERAPDTFNVRRWDDHDLTYPGAAEDVPMFELGEYACIAEGQLVLTDRGPVPIEKVTTSDRLWDGVEWVSHGGVICKGTQRTITHGALTATPDHLILTPEGDYACFASIAAGARRSVAVEDGQVDSRIPDADRAHSGRQASSPGRGEVLTVRSDVLEAGERSTAWTPGVSVSVGAAVRGRSSGSDPGSTVARHAPTLHPGIDHVEESRGPGNRGAVRVSGVLHPMDAGEPSPRVLSRCADRPNRQRKALRAGEPATGVKPSKLHEPTEYRVCGVHGSAGCPSPSVAPGKDGRSVVPDWSARAAKEAAAGDDGAGSFGRSVQTHLVYDILNAGPRHRFSVSGLIVSNCRDTYYTWKLADLHRETMWLGEGTHADGGPQGFDEIENARLGRLASWVAMPTVASLTSIEQRGIMLDETWVKSELDANIHGRQTLLAQLADIYGMSQAGASTAATSQWFKELTRRAIEAGDLQVAALTPTGQPQWSKAVLVRQARSGSEVAQLVLDQRGHVKRAEYLGSWLEHQSSDGAIHSTYHSGRVVSGRLSSSDPNMQQVTKDLRPAFIPRPGMVLVDIDYSQIELRVAAFISRCQPMIEAFQNNEDLHTLLASRITGKTPDNVTKDDRQRGKSANFGLLYAMSPQGFREYAETAYGVSLTIDEAQEVHSAFFEQWSGMRQWHDRSISSVRASGQVTSPIGRVRRLPDVWDGNERLASMAERAAINSPVQGFASDLMQLAAASIQGLVPGHEAVPGAHLVATVHDSIVLEAPETSWEEVTRACIDRMISPHRVLQRLDCHLDVPLVAEAVAGTRWGLSDVGELS